ncbi:MAG TPA: FecR family protein [Candidatus Omnitrophota bacterium]|nr:FecR family protein [Candidatus Omnitrophota bacterium]HRZ14429.1 FecR family protein [Candidatus Omnitrophota bacterium]
MRRKTALLSCGIGVFVGLLTACGGWPAGDVVRAQTAQQAEITSLSGTVEVLLKEADGYAPAEEGMILEAGDTLKTGGSSSAELAFNEDNTNLVRLSEYTTVRLTLSVDEKLEMTDGEVFATVNALSCGSSFEIRTPTAVSGARGTDWVTKVTADGTDVEAVDSQPYVRHFESSGEVSQQFTPIQPGQMTTVRKFQRPAEMRPVSGVRRQQWQSLKQDVRRRGGEAMVKRQQRPAFNRQDFKQRIKQSAGEGFRPLRSGDQPARAQQAEEIKQQIKDSPAAQKMILPVKDGQAVKDAQPAKNAQAPKNPPPAKAPRSGGGGGRKR